MCINTTNNITTTIFYSKLEIGLNTFLYSCIPQNRSMQSCLTDDIISDACNPLIETASKIMTRSIVRLFQEINIINPPKIFFFICKYFQIMHLSMSSRLGGGEKGGRQHIGQGFDIFQKIAIKFPTPGKNARSNITEIPHHGK